MSKWDGKTKGTLLGYQFFVFFVQKLGLNFSYSILRIIVSYYYFFAKKARKGLISFYQQALLLSPSDAKKMTRRNFTVFGQTLLDRIAFLAGKSSAFSLTFENEDYLVQMREAGRGGILLSAHLGNWEMAGNLLNGRITPLINVVMLDAEVAAIKSYLEQQTGGARFQVIAIKDDLSHVIKISNALKNNEFVAIHADRYMEGVRCIELPFLGKKAKFPYGPFLIASKFDAPVTFVFGVKAHKFSYHLSATLPLNGKYKPEEIAQLFVEELERRVKRNPEQWFNYFDFFDNASE